MSHRYETVNAQATNEDFEFDALEEAVNYRKALVDEFRPYLRGRILEVGAGIGQFSRELTHLKDIEAIDAIEPDLRLYNRLSEQRLNLRCLHSVVADLDPLWKYDAIISVNVLEHIGDHFDELKRYKQRINPGGYLCLFVPACPSLYAPIDHHFGHFRRYQREELRELLKQAGFQITKLHYYNSLGFFAWWLNFCLLKKTSFETVKVRFYDRYLFPLVHILESRMFRPPLGQNLLAIVQA